MPIYVFRCEKCEDSKEIRQPIGAEAPVCCGESMEYVFAPIAMVKMKGTPSFRKRYLGTAPYTTRAVACEKVKGGLGAKGARAKMQGEKWLGSIA